MKREGFIRVLAFVISTVPVSAGIITVQQDGTGDFLTIQAAVDAAVDGDRVVVGPGTYTGEGNRDILLRDKSIRIQSVDPNDPELVKQTVLDCAGSSEEPHRAFLIEQSREKAFPRISGLTITHGFADQGGGVCADVSESQYVLTIDNCVFLGNTATERGGGGVYSKVRLLIRHCHFLKNAALYGSDGGAIRANELIAVQESTFEENTASEGGAIYAAVARELFRCRFTDNVARREGGGINSWHAIEKVRTCVFQGNAAEDGGGLYCKRYLQQMQECQFVANRAGHSGAALYVGSVVSDITNCTIAYNRAGVEGGGMFHDSPRTSRRQPSGTEDRPITPIKIINSIVWYNEDSLGQGLGAQLAGGAYSVQHSCVQDEDPHDQGIPYSEDPNHANIDDDPHFVRLPNDGGDGWGDDPDSPLVDEGVNDDFGDLHLEYASPCIDAGNNRMWTGPKHTDIDGEPRKMGGNLDMGFDEVPYWVEVTVPRGAELWAAGSHHAIRWESRFSSGLVDINISCDGGNNWQSLTTAAPDTGHHDWHIPVDLNTENCVIQVLPSGLPEKTLNLMSGPFSVRPDRGGPTIASSWQTLGGRFTRAGQSDYPGPKIGCVKWTFALPAPVISSPVVGVDKRIHLACQDGKLYTLGQDGTIVWTFDAGVPLTSGPTLGGDGSVLVGCERGILHVIDPRGRERWTHYTGDSIHACPALAPNGHIYVGSMDGALHALDTDGSELWTTHVSGFETLPGAVFASPTVGEDGTLYVGALYDPNLYALDPNDGSVRWSFTFSSEGWPVASAVMGAGGILYQVLMNDTQLYAINASDGSLQWRLDLKNEAWEDCEPARPYSSTCTPSDGWSEPVLGADGTIYVSLDDPYLRAIDPNGSLLWSTRLGNVGGFTLTSAQNGLVYAACDDGALYVVDANGLEVARIQTDQWLNYPVVSGDNLLVACSAGEASAADDVNEIQENLVWVLTDCNGL